MKKLISLLVAFLVVSTSLTGCSSNTDEPVVDNETTQTSYDVEKSADVIIVGAGGAGLARLFQLWIMVRKVSSSLKRIHVLVVT